MSASATVIPDDGHRLAYMDGLRAVAVLAVIAHHVIRYMPALANVTYVDNDVPATALARAGRFFIEGSHGVDLFFVISGFCLAYPTLARLHTGGESRFELANYAIKRVLRIVPPYELALFACAIAALVAQAFQIGLPPPMPQRPLEAWSFLSQVFLLDRNVDFLTGSFWTLAVEFRWYFFFPIALALYVRSPRFFAAVLVAALIANDFTRFHAVDVAVLPAFLSGIVAADWALRGVRFQKSLWIAFPLAIIAALLLEASTNLPSPIGNADSHALYYQGNHGWQLVCFLGVVLAGSTPIVRRILATRALTTIGVAAYSIYLVHEPIVAAAQPLLHASLGDVGAAFAAAGLAIFAGLICSFLIEQPLLRAMAARSRTFEFGKQRFTNAFTWLGIPLVLTFRRDDASRLAVAADAGATQPEARAQRAGTGAAYRN